MVGDALIFALIFEFLSLESGWEEKLPCSG